MLYIYIIYVMMILRMCIICFWINNWYGIILVQIYIRSKMKCFVPIDKPKKGKKRYSKYYT